jgi:porphobilinogen synthase
MTIPTASYPALRLRRTRAIAWSRAMFTEHRLHPGDLIWPLFVTEGSGIEEPIARCPASRAGQSI